MNSPAAYYSLYRVNRDGFFAKLKDLSDSEKFQVCMSIIRDFDCISLAWEFFDRETNVVLRLPTEDAQYILGEAWRFEYSGLMDRIGRIIESGDAERIGEILHGGRATYLLKVSPEGELTKGEKVLSEALRHLAMTDPDEFFRVYAKCTRDGGFFRHLSSEDSAAFLSVIRNHSASEMSALTVELARNLNESELGLIVADEEESNPEFLGALLAVAQAGKLSMGLRDLIADGLPEQLVVDSLLMGMEMSPRTGDGPAEDLIDAGQELMKMEQAQQIGGEQGARLARLFLEVSSPLPLLENLEESLYLPSGQTVFTEILREWSRLDPVGASAYLSERMAAGKSVPDESIRALAANLEPYPEAAAAWGLILRNNE